MFGQTNHGQRRYYRHARHRVNKCEHSPWIPADDIEKAVLIYLFGTYGNVSSMEKAIQRAIPDRKKVNQLQERKIFVEKELNAVKNEFKRIMNAIAKHIITDKEAADTAQNLRKRDSSLEEEKTNINQQLDHLPSREKTEMAAKVLQHCIRRICKRADQLLKMTYEQQRELIQTAFTGKDSQGKRLGVYIRKSNNSQKVDSFIIRGAINIIDGTLPLTRKEILSTLEIDLDFPGQDKLLADITNFACPSPGPGLRECRFSQGIAPHPA